MPTQLQIAILIMAAGSSSRMGKPKQLLKWKNSNLLNHAIEIANRLDSKSNFVVLGSNADAIIPEIKSTNINILINENWKEGLGNSISFGVSSILRDNPGLDGLMIMLADQPLINLDHYLKLIKIFTKGKNQIIATKYSDEKLGVPAVFDQIYFNDLSILNSDFGAKGLFKKYAEFVNSIRNENASFDIDTPVQYEQFYRDNHS